MRIKLDENLPSRLAFLLGRFGHDVDTVHSEGLSGCRDDALWEECQKKQRFLITQDLDFSDMRKFLPGSHRGLLVVRYKNPGRSEITKKVQAIFQHENPEEWAGCFVVATDRKIRIHRPE